MHVSQRAFEDLRLLGLTFVVIFPVLVGALVAGALQLNTGEVPVVDELAQFAMTAHVEQLPCGFAVDHRGLAAKDMMQL